MSDSNDRNNGLGLLSFLGIVALDEYFTENEPCEHKIKKRDYCATCEANEIERRNKIFTTGLAYALFTNFFSMLFSIILYAIGSIIIGGVVLLICDVFVPAYAVTFGYIVGFAIFTFWFLRNILDVVRQIRFRNDIYYTSTDNRRIRLPASLSVKFWAGKTYLGSYPQIYYLKK